MKFIVSKRKYWYKDFHTILWVIPEKEEHTHEAHLEYLAQELGIDKIDIKWKNL